MNKISYYGRRLGAPVYPYNYNYNHINYIGYVHPYKKNIFKNRQKLNNPPVKNIYFEERKKIPITITPSIISAKEEMGTTQYFKKGIIFIDILLILQKKKKLKKK